MVSISQQFYEKAYPNNRKADKPKGILGFLYLLLKRFEYYRADVVFHLLPYGDTFLDIGCGDGDLIMKASAKFDHLFGTDIARTRIKTADKSLKKISSQKGKSVKLLVSDADGKLPFGANYFDAVTMVATLEHFFDPYQVLKEVSRILKVGGTLIIQVPNLAFLPRRFAVLLGNLPVTSEDETGWDGGHLHYFTVKSLRDLLELHHYSMKTVTCSGIFAVLRKNYISMLGADIIISAVKQN